jgi:hypothetical protein
MIYNTSFCILVVIILNNPMMSEKTENQKELEFIQKSLRENHELRQVCLEVLSCLNKTQYSKTLIIHCKSELNRVLFSPDDFLH